MTNPTNFDVDAQIASGYELRRQGQPELARKSFQEAVNNCKDALERQDEPNKKDALQEDGHQWRYALARSLVGLGQTERDLVQTPAALQHYQEAADLYRGLNEPLVLAHTLRHVADIMRNNGDDLLSAMHYNQALAIYRDQPQTKPLDLANTLRGYALLKAETGHSEASIAYFQEALNLYESAAIQTGLDLQPAFDEIGKQMGRLGAI